MRRFAVLLALLLALSGEARASMLDGNKLFQECKENFAAAQAYCMAYITGVFDALEDNSIGGFRSCPPGVSVRQIRDVAVQWLERHPQHRHLAAAGLVAAALAEAFPCRKK